MKPIEIESCHPAGQLINTSAELENICTKIEANGRVAVDTEFVWERTYYPNLGIVQLALDEKEAWLLDMPALQGKLDPLGRVLANPEIEKIIHDAKQDLTILRQATGFYPENIFDTRLAAGFIGSSATLSLLDTCAIFANQVLNKGETRSNWLQRPLTVKQFQYALDDVLFLPLIRDEIMSQAEKLGRDEWIVEEMKLYDNPSLYNDPDADQVYVKVKGASRLNRKELAVLLKLAAWREQTACLRNRPRRHIISDESLLKISQSMPQDRENLKQNCALSLRASQRYGEQLLRTVKEGLQMPEADFPELIKRSRNPKIADSSRKLMELIADIGETHNLDSALIATRKDIEKVLTKTDQTTIENARLLQGWRFKLVGEKVISLLTAD